MFAKTWRDHWDLSEDPFAFEDADKDPFVTRVDASAVHSSFDRIFGNAETPAPGIVFGEKGSGKSGLRLAMQRGIEKHNAAHHDARVFQLDYVEFDAFFDRARQAAHLPADKEKTTRQVVEKWRLVDHIDAILSNGVTRLVDRWEEQRTKPKGLDRKQKADLLALVALYYDSPKRARGAALRRTRSKLRFSTLRPGITRLWLLLLSIASAGLGLMPHYAKILDTGPDWEIGPAKFWYASGMFMFAATWLWFLFIAGGVRSRATRAARSVRVMPDEPGALQGLLSSMSPKARNEVALPAEDDEPSRFHLLGRFLSILKTTGYTSVYVLMDRVDESTFLFGKGEWTRPFVRSMLDHRLLQHPNMALKLFLPIELGQMYLGATPEELRRMRLDKSNTVQELRWTGQELYEVANQRLRAARTTDSGSAHLSDFFQPNVEAPVLCDALHELGTPRYAFGFLSALFAEYARNLPDELDPDSTEWRIPRSHFELLRATWGDRTRALRRAMN